tara:strand:- start:71 stop:1075 length:1005 start_codon:yes stop_codon:yes gene_type:complete
MNSKINHIASKKLNVLIIGLGNAGSRFDEEARNLIWSHTGAYLSSPDVFNIVNGIDIKEKNRKLFDQRLKQKKAVASIQQIDSKDIDIISIATPYEYRLSIFEEIFEHNINPHVIICEKPLALHKDERDKIISICRSNNTKLLVHYNRRYISTYIVLKEIIQGKKYGEVYSITIKCPNRSWSIGSHAIDLLLYLIDEKPVKWEVLNIPSLVEDEEKAFDFIGFFESGIVGRILTQGPSKILIFELEVVCELARIKLNKNGEQLFVEKYEQSYEYQSYLIPSFLKELKVKQDSSFISIVENAKDIIFNDGEAISTGTTASYTEELLDNIQKKLKK